MDGANHSRARGVGLAIFTSEKQNCPAGLPYAYEERNSLEVVSYSG